MRKNQFLISLLLLSVFIFLTPMALIASTHILAFNWGSSQGIKKALKAAETDAEWTQKGYPIGPKFWESLQDSQSDTDHKAGDGLYFSTHPLDSSRFGPSLLILEIEIENMKDAELIKSMPAEQAHVHPDLLPTIVSFRGSWHVIKSLPRNKKIKIWIREPTLKDIDTLFQRFHLNQDLAQVLNLITAISHRYSYRFKRYESQESIPKNQQNNKSTQKFMDALIDALVEKGLGKGSVDFSDPEKFSQFKSSLSNTLHTLSQQQNEKNIFGRNMTKAIYKKLLRSPAPWPASVTEILRAYNVDYYNKYNTPQIGFCHRLFF